MPGISDLASLNMMIVVPMVMAIGAFFLAIQATMGLVTAASNERIMNRRLKFKDKYASTSEAMIELRKSRGLDDQGNFATTMRWFNQLVVRSGVKFQPVRWAAMALVAGVVAMGAFWHFVGVLWGLPLVFLFVAFALPVFALKQIGSKRMKKMAEQLPDALQIVCRSLEAGHPVATSVSLVAREMPDPIGTEFGMAADEVSYGMSLTHAVQRMAERVGDPDVELFAATVRLQEKTGGNLTELLKANTTTIRQRQIMRLKVRAASSEGRVSAMILTAAPFIVMTAIHLLKPDFYGAVSGDPQVQKIFIGLFIWMGIGNLVMNKMINFKM